MAKRLTLESIFSAVDRVTGPVKTMQSKLEVFTKRASSSFGFVAKKSSLFGDALRGMIPAVSLAAGAKALADFAGRGDDIARNAGILGLTAKAYQELSYAANMADVDQEAFAAATKKLNMNLGQLRQKTGTLYSTLAKSNPALARQLKNAKDTDDAFNLVAQAIAKETNVQKRAALAVAAFGKSGQDLIPMLQDLGALRKEAQDSGTIIDDKDVATASRLDDSLKRLKASGLSLANNALARIAEKMAPVIERADEWIKKNRDLIDLKIGDALKMIGNAFAFLKESWDNGTLKVLTEVVATLWALHKVLQAIDIITKANPFLLTAAGMLAYVDFMKRNATPEAMKARSAGMVTAADGSPLPASRGGIGSPTMLPLDAPLAPVSTSSSSYAETRQTVGFDFSGMPAGVKAKVGAPIPTLQRGPVMQSTLGFGG